MKFEITTKFTQIKNGEYNIKVDEEALEILQNGLVYLTCRKFYDPWAINKQHTAKKMIDEISEVLE